MTPSDDDFRARLRDIVARSGRSMRGLSAAMGRDPGYVAALLDPARPSRARPTPADLLRLSDETGMPFVELLEAVWGIESSRLVAELGPAVGPLGGLSAAERAEVADFAEFVRARHRRDPRARARGPWTAQGSGAPRHDRTPRERGRAGRGACLRRLSPSREPDRP